MKKLLQQDEDDPSKLIVLYYVKVQVFAKANNVENNRCIN